MSASRYYKEICGVIGGVGPEATDYFFQRIIKLTNAQRDQDHIPILIFNNPQIPDRTEHLVHNGKDPFSEILHTAEILKKAGATFLAIPCNTAHAYVQELEAVMQMPVLDMIRLTAQFISHKFINKTIVGLLATDGTIQLLFPDEREQKNVMEAIYGEKGIKASYVDEHNFQLIYQEAKKLIDRRAEVIIAGCTEIPLVMPHAKCNFPLIDPMEILAIEVIKRTESSRIHSPTSKNIL